MTEKAFNLISLRAENFMKLSAVLLGFDEHGEMVTLTGPNEAGKSAVLHALEWGLGGDAHAPEELIRRGENGATVVLDLGEIVVTREVEKGKRQRLKIAGRDGKKYLTHDTPQALLSKLYAKCAFDPEALDSASPKEQAAAFQEAMGLDFSERDAKHAAAYENRTEIGRDIKRVKGALDSTEYHEGVPAEPVSVAELSEELERRREVNRGNDHARERAEHFAGLKEGLKERIAGLQNELDQCNEVLEGWADKAKSCEDLDTDEVSEQIRTAEDTNAKARSNAEHHRLSMELEDLGNQRNDLTAQIDDIDNSKRDDIAAAPVQIRGLSFSEDGAPLLDDLPISVASTARRIITWCKVYMAQNPKLRLMFIRNASNLDAKALAEVAEFAQENDCKIIAEDNRSTDPAAIIIEDGEVRG